MLWIYFFIGLFFTLTMPAIFPSLKFFYFIPFLVRCYYLKPFKSCLWLSIGVGLILDLFSSDQRFGLYACNYFLTTYFLYSYKRHFFEDSITTLPIMTYFFSVLSTAFHWCLLLLIDRYYIPITPPFILTDFLLMPLGEVAFTVAIFTIPTLFFGKPVRRGSDYFLKVD